jgi:hypothetical protein
MKRFLGLVAAALITAAPLVSFAAMDHGSMKMDHGDHKGNADDNPEKVVQDRTMTQCGDDEHCSHDGREEHHILIEYVEVVAVYWCQERRKQQAGG